MYGIPPDALRLQLVSRELRAIAKRAMANQLEGLSSSIAQPFWDRGCYCVPYDKAFSKHSRLIYMLNDGFKRLNPGNFWWPRKLEKLRSWMDFGISVEEWRKILNIKDELYTSEYRRDWSLTTVVDTVIPAVAERVNPRFRLPIRHLESRDISRKLALLTELNIRMVAPIAVSHLPESWIANMEKD